jgi:hypothetical protein
LTASSSQEEVTLESPQGTEFEIDVIYTIVPQPEPLFGLFRSKRPDMKLIVNLPQTIPNFQIINIISFDPEPSKKFFKNGNYYAEYTLTVPKEKKSLGIHIEAIVYQYDLATAMKKIKTPPAPDPNLQQFLINERMIEKDDPLIQKIAQEISGGNDLEVVKEIHRYIIKYLDVDVSKAKGVGAAKTAQTKKGMCIDYCDLFVALCRAKNIPARVTAGYQSPFTLSPKHSWAEVYLIQYGWVPIDPTMPPYTPDTAIELAFYNILHKRLYYTHIRNDTTLNYNYFYYFGPRTKEVFKFLKDVHEEISFIKPNHQVHNSEEDTQKKRNKDQEEYEKFRKQVTPISD